MKKNMDAVATEEAAGERLKQLTSWRLNAVSIRNGKKFTYNTHKHYKSCVFIDHAYQPHLQLSMQVQVGKALTGKGRQ